MFLRLGILNLSAGLTRENRQGFDTSARIEKELRKLFVRNFRYFNCNLWFSWIGHGKCFKWMEVLWLLH